jgi:regulatory protein
MDVRTKLIEHQVYGDILEEILADLISENFLNEMRYASAYVSGKFKINEWGRIKIIAGLKQKNISLKIITKAISEIDEHMYLKTLEKLYQNKKQLLKPKSLQDKQRLMNYLLQKGFEQHLIFEIMNKP